MTAELEMEALCQLGEDPLEIRGLFGQFPSGVLALGADVAEAEVGMAVSSFTTISLDPVLIAVSIRTQSQTWPRLVEAASIGVSLLADDHGPLARQLAGPDEAARFDGVRPVRTPEGALLVPEAVCWMVGTVETTVEAGDHLIAVLGIQRAAQWHEREPLVFHRSRFSRLGLDD